VRRSIAVVLCAVAALGTAAACSGQGGTTRPAADAGSSSRPAATTPATPKPPVASGVTVGVIEKSGALAFYRVGRDRRARLITSVEAPRAGQHAGSVSIAAGSQARACATWVHDNQVDEPTSGSTLACYALDGSGTSATPTEVVGNPTVVAVSADGSRMAWIDYGARNNETDVVFGTLSGDSLVDVQRVKPGGDILCTPCLEGVSSVAWSGDDALVLSRNGQDDEGRGLGLLPLDASHVARGWYDGPTTMSAWKSDHPYVYFDDVVSATDQSALAIERPSYNGPPPHGVRDRAVMVDFASGLREAIIATALPGRRVAAVSGGAGAVVYGTVRGYDSDPRFYLKLPGDTIGQLITGLPDDTTEVIAQAS
jgi:hypothetical protein